MASREAAYGTIWRPFASPRFIHVSFDINNAPVSSGAWNASKTIIKLPWKLRTCARVRRTVCAQINRMESHSKQSTWRGVGIEGIKKKREEGREVRDGQRWGDRDRTTKAVKVGGFLQMMKPRDLHCVGMMRMNGSHQNTLQMLSKHRKLKVSIMVTLRQV